MLLFVIFVSLLPSAVSVTQERFYKGILCDLDRRMHYKCSRSLQDIHTLHKCVVVCSEDPTCVGASIVSLKNGENEENICHLHSTCPSVIGCDSKHPEHRYESKQCAHGGTWDPSTSTCSCVNSWVGENCLQLPNKCTDLLTNGYKPGEHRTFLDFGNKYDSPTPVLCEFDQLGWNSIIIMFNGGISNTYFNKSWEEYRSGFFHDNANFWMGLQPWHVLSMEGYNNLIMVYHFGDGGGNVYREYFGLRVNDESHGYSFNYDRTVAYFIGRAGGVSGNHFGDCLGPLKDVPFSTPIGTGSGTSARSVYNNNCASSIGSGWWYPHTACDTGCNMLGIPPKYWNSSTPASQKMRVLGVRDDVFNVYLEGARTMMYLMR